MRKDIWSPRDKTYICGTCQFFVLKNTTKGSSDAAIGFMGRCRRRSPTMSGYPVVFELDWCGDHKLDEEKL